MSLIYLAKKRQILLLVVFALFICQLELGMISALWTTMFLYFLDKNGVLFLDGKKLIDDHTLVALTIMIAESRPEEMEMMITVIMN